MLLAEIVDKIEVGTVIQFEDGEIILIGDASPSREPTDNDGGLGWGDYLDKPVSKIRRLPNWKDILGFEWYDRVSLQKEGVNLKDAR